MQCTSLMKTKNPTQSMIKFVTSRIEAGAVVVEAFKEAVDNKYYLDNDTEVDSAMQRIILFISTSRYEPTLEPLAYLLVDVFKQRANSCGSGVDLTGLCTEPWRAPLLHAASAGWKP